MPYFTRHICQLFNVTPPTVRSWTEEFGAYLSEGARTSAGRHRLFTDEDLRVFSFVSQMRRNNEATFVEIETLLKAGQRGELPLFINTQKEEPETIEKESQLVLQLQYLQQVITGLEQERAALLPMRDEVTRLQALKAADEKLMEAKDKRIAELAAELKAAQDEIRKLDREMGRLESRISKD
jgi:DNA-binding transcriptional MerR regulator